MPPAQVFAVVEGIGGSAAGSTERFCGGCGRCWTVCWAGLAWARDGAIPITCVQGDALDFWRVEEMTRGKRLCLKAMMKVPGEAYLMFETIPLGTGKTRLRSSALFRPRGLMGRIYWWMLLPIHKFIFSGMNAAIRKRASNQTNHVTSTPATTGSAA